MRKGSLFGVCVLVVIMAFSLSGRAQAETIKIGINAPLTGDIPKVGEGTKFAAQMWLEDVKAAGGLTVGKKKYTVELVLEDNESKAESAVKVATKMITEDGVLVMVGPQASKQAIPAGGIANNYKTVMITPWSTNPDTTKNRPYVFRACFLDPFQGPVVGQFHFNGVQIHQGCRPVRRGERLSQGTCRVLQEGLGRQARQRFRRGVRKLHHQGYRLQRPVDEDHQFRRPGAVHPPVL